MIQPTDTYLEKNDLSDKSPLYTIHFAGEDTDYCNLIPISPAVTYKKYLKGITGLTQTVTPERGKASISSVKVELTDYNNEITTLMGTDPYNFQNREVEIKAGYVGMEESELLLIATGWVSDIDLSKNAGGYIFEIQDPQSWLLKEIFIDATDDSPLTLAGNPINIILAIMTSTGTGTNGDYDYLAANDGVGLDINLINLEHIEYLRDSNFPGASNFLSFRITESSKARDWLSDEILRLIFAYPVVNPDGKFDLKLSKPALPTTGDQPIFTDDDIVGMPKMKGNFSALINTVEIYYDYDEEDDEFDSVAQYTDEDSIENRGAGSSVFKIESKGLRTGNIATQDMLDKIGGHILYRYATPPIQIEFKAFYSKLLSEVGDIASFTHSLLPDLETGTRGLTGKYIELTKRTAQWRKGYISFSALDTNYGRALSTVVSPTMTVVSDTRNSETIFYVSLEDAAKYIGYSSPVIQLYSANMEKQGNVVTITVNLNPNKGEIYCDDLGLIPQEGWIVVFAEYDDVTDEQKHFGYVADANNELGTDKDPAHIVAY